MRFSVLVCVLGFTVIEAAPSQAQQLLWTGQVDGYSPCCDPAPWVQTVEVEVGMAYHVIATGIIDINYDEGGLKDCNGCDPEDPTACAGHDPTNSFLVPEELGHALLGRACGRTFSGCGFAFAADCTGVLELNFNETSFGGAWQYSDNSGHYDVQVWGEEAVPSRPVSWGTLKARYQ